MKRCCAMLAVVLGVVAGGLCSRPVAAAPAPAVSPVVVIHGSRSLAAEGDRRFALSLARHAVRWFREGGLVADLHNDERLDTTLRGRQVALLVHCADVQADQLRALQAFTGRGGTLIACYSSSPGLASLMGVRVGAYLKVEQGRFAAMRFGREKPVNTPQWIQQSSPNIMTAIPVDGAATVLAEWVDRAGRPTGQAAWIQSRAGFWMTHTLSADGHAAAKGRLLVALAGDRHPELWLTAARARLARGRVVGPWREPEEGLATADALPDAERRGRARQAVTRAIEARREAEALLVAGRGAEAWLLAHEMHERLLAAYGVMQQSVRGEIRAVWDHSGQGLYPGDWARTCRLLQAAGISDILVNVAAPGFAHCRLDALPRSPVYETQGDQLAACLAAAHPLGIRVHAWLIAFSTTHATAHRRAVFSTRNWLLQDTDGRPTAWLDPANPEVRAMLVQAGRELFERYPIDGLHLDFVRYANLHESLGPATRRRFEAARGRPVSNWPAAARTRPVYDEVVRWRVAQVTALVADMRRLQRQVAPGRWLTAAVFGKHPSCVEAVGQDWESWIEQGYIDYVMPMNYTESLPLFAELVGHQTRTRRLSSRIIGGLGVTAAESRLDAAAVIDQVNALRAARAVGFALFDLDATLEQDILPVIQLGLTAPATGVAR